MEENGEVVGTVLQEGDQRGVYKKEKEGGKFEEGGRKEGIRAKILSSCVNSPGGKVYLKGLPDIDSTRKGAVGKSSKYRSTIPAFNFHNTLDAKGKVKTILNNHQKEPVIESFVQPLIANTADMEKSEIQRLEQINKL